MYVDGDLHTCVFVGAMGNFVTAAVNDKENRTGDERRVWLKVRMKVLL